MSYSIKSIPVIQRGVAKPELKGDYDGVKTSTEVLQKGHKKGDDWREFPVNTIYERDIKIPVRDGAILYGDIFRPADVKEKVPVLLAWGPFGKRGVGAINLDMLPGRLGVPRSKNSGYEKWEACDPAEWTQRGYAIANVDSRGAYDSEGNIRWFGSYEAQDGYDVIEHLASLSWCNGRVCMVGNSWLAVSQWFIAAQHPPHLKCIAPFEGIGDIYREVTCRGGVPAPAFFNFIAEVLRGRNEQEDLGAMLAKYPLYNDYWDDKRAKMEDIEIPTYILGSYSSILHTMGAFRAFEEIRHQQKWLRVHPHQEWYDLYSQETNDELQLFFDRYMKDVANGWEKTPSVRISLLGYNEPTLVNHVFENYPIPQTQHLTLYLNEGKRLQLEAPRTNGVQSYLSDIIPQQDDNDREELMFKYTFDKRSYLVGNSKAIVYISCPDSDDMDVFVQLRKVDKAGKILKHLNIPLGDLGMTEEQVPNLNPFKYTGPTGILRASHRALDDKLSKPHWPVHHHQKEEKIVPGTIVKLEIGLWAAGMIFSDGESIVLKISGHWMTLPEFPALRGKMVAQNNGRHYVHYGAGTPSHVILPLVEL